MFDPLFSLYGAIMAFLGLFSVQIFLIVQSFLIAVLGALQSSCIHMNAIGKKNFKSIFTVEKSLLKYLPLFGLHVR